MVLLVTLLLGVAASPAGADTIDYLSPAPGSRYVSEKSNIIVRPGGLVDGTTVAPGRVRVAGSLSGAHSGRIRLSDDRQTLTFDPDAPFTPGETVTCAVTSGLKTDKKGDVPPQCFTFTVAGPERVILPTLPGFASGEEELTGGVGQDNHVDSIPPPPPPPPVPPDFPPITSSVFGTTAPGRLFLANLNLGRATDPAFIMILDNDGRPFFQRRVPALALDFKKQPDGRLTYFDDHAKCFYALDATYAVVDSFRTGNGYVTDGHDLQILPNGHALLMSYDPELVDLTPVRPGGPGIAVGLIIQELDLEKEVVFQWRSWDHFQLTDGIGRLFLSFGYDYVHGNSIDADSSGDLLLSCRSMDEITKISRATGEILWRLGGKNNQFTFVNDPLRFNRQHDARWLPNGNLTVFDNGNSRFPPFSRAVEYVLDEAQKTATLVWQYRLTPDVFGPALGSVQRFANGNTLICWGATNPTLTEVAPDGAILMQLSFAPGTTSYRGVRFEWPPVKAASITFRPASIAKGITGGSLGAVIEPVDSDFDVADIDLSTVRLQETVPASTAQLAGDGNGDGIPDLTVQFARAAIDPLLSVGTNLLTVSGSLRTGEVFRGAAALRVFAPSTTRPASIQLVSAPGALPVVLEAGASRAGARTLAIYDVQGRLVRRWRTTPDGGAIWDGNRSDGSRATAGVYFVRTEDGVPGEAAKLVIVR